jgi:hypothetical protein
MLERSPESEKKENKNVKKIMTDKSLLPQGS